MPTGFDGRGEFQPHGSAGFYLLEAFDRLELPLNGVLPRRLQEPYCQQPQREDEKRASRAHTYL
jgi:hypothetical protein